MYLRCGSTKVDLECVCDKLLLHMPYCYIVFDVVITHKIKKKYPVIYISLVIQICGPPKVVGVVRK